MDWMFLLSPNHNIRELKKTHSFIHSKWPALCFTQFHILNHKVRHDLTTTWKISDSCCHKIECINHFHKPEIWRTEHHEKVDNGMSRIDPSHINATLSEAKPQNVVIQSQNCSVETVLSQLTGTEFTITHKLWKWKALSHDNMHHNSYDTGTYCNTYRHKWTSGITN